MKHNPFTYIKNVMYWWLAASLIAWSSVYASVDLRINDPAVLNGSSEIQYTAAFSNCDDLISVSVGTSESVQSIELQDLILEGTSCAVSFSVDGDSRFSPLVEFRSRSTGLQTHGETFVFEQITPNLEFIDVQIVGEAADQSLIVNVRATDDTDISYLSFDVVGLRASDLRQAGGVIAEAKRSAFVSTASPQRLFPNDDSQIDYRFSIPISGSLSAEQIAFDTIVLVNVMAVDSSGNHASLSQVAFTGDSIQEEALALIVSNTGIVINNALQTPVIIPSVEFQFRGVVPLEGAGNGVSYQSSHPNLIGVTNAGVVYALEETGVQDVNIIVSYPGLPDVSVPVEADFSKTLVGIGIQGVSPDTPFVLPSLNRFFDLPEIQGVFDDGSRTAITGIFTPVISISNSLSAFLELNSSQELRANVAIDDSAPALLNLSLAELDGLSSVLPVAAIDGEPEINFELPSSIESNTELLLQANVSDDVGIAQVNFRLNGASVGVVAQQPYQLTLPISEQLEGQTLKFTAEVTDTIGQKTLSTEREISVRAPRIVVIPEYDFVLPIDGNRIVESSPIRYQIETFLGNVPDTSSSSGIRSVDFTIDGEVIGSATFPQFDLRSSIVDGEEIQALYEIWAITSNAPNISTRESATSVGAQVFSSSGSNNAPARLIRIIENGPPTVTILSPVEGSQATQGQDLELLVEIRDESLSLGAQVELLVDGEVIATEQYSNPADISGALLTSKATVNFVHPITAEDIGSTLRFQARVIDFHQDENVSEVLRVPVKADQPPTIALSNPTQGASFVSGLPLQIRANAVDDLEVARVDFFVNSQLVGSDEVAPYAYVFETPDNINTEQVLTLSAVAVDSANQEANSNEVEVTLGRDEEPPVVNISSPFITGTDAGDDIAGVLEQSEFVVRIAGFDNVAAERALLRGVSRDSNGFILTGNSEDVLEGSDFPIEQIPGALNAYGALRLMRAPAFRNLTSGEFDRYPVSVSVFDGEGNSSTADIIIGVFADEKPEVVSITPEQIVYGSQDPVNIDLLLRDDRSVESFRIDYRLNSELIRTVEQNRDTGLIPQSTLQARDTLNLANLAVENQDATLEISVSAMDILGQQSDVLTHEILVRQDRDGPIAAIVDPIQGGTLFSGDRVLFQYRAVDESQISSIEITRGDLVVFTSQTPNQLGSGSFEVEIPSDIETIEFTLKAVDVHGNDASTTASYPVSTDQPPVISVRQPAAGSRLVEGEPFTVTALVNDNRELSSVEIFVELDGVSLFSKKFNATQANQIIASSEFFSANLRVPNRPEVGELLVGVKAVDNVGLAAQFNLDLVILDDPESPVISYTEPSENFALYPGESFNVEGVASDNIYIDDLQKNS